MLIRTQLMLPKDVYDALKLEASMKSTSMSKIVTKKLKSKSKKKLTGAEFLKSLVKNAYKGKNVPRDLSTNDDYLYGPNGAL